MATLLVTNQAPLNRLDFSSGVLPNSSNSTKAMSRGLRATAKPQAVSSVIVRVSGTARSSA